MMNAISGYFMKVFGMALITGVVSAIAGKGINGTICKMAGGLLLIAAALSPFKENSFKVDLSQIFDSSITEEVLDNAQKRSYEIKNSVIASKLEAYTEEGAKEKGVNVSVKIIARSDEENNFFIVSASAAYQTQDDYENRDIVKKILSEECGIGEEKQRHYIKR